MNRLFKDTIKIIIISIVLIDTSCYFIMERDNANDPDSDNFIPPTAIANFTASVNEGNARLKVDFTDKSSGDIVVWEWDFDNDGTIDSTERNPSYTYNFNGTFSVKLKVWESRRLVSDETVKTDYIEVKIGYPIMNIVKNDFNGAISASAADIDNDGDQDIIGMSFYEGEIIWCENNELSWIEHKIKENIFFLWSVIPVDIDEDGDIDIISAGKYSGIYWWENRKGEDENWKDTWSFHAVDYSFADARYTQAVDMDNDGDLDIVGASYEDSYNSKANSELSWWENMDINPGTGDGNAYSWTKHKLTGENTDENFKGITHLSVTNPDSDGDWDIFFTENNTGRISILENRKGEMEDWKDSFTEHTVDAAFSAARSVYSADMDNDGDLDIIGLTYGTWNSELGKCENSYVCWWENTCINDIETSSWEKHIVYDNLDGGPGLIAKDINGDGDMDIACTSIENDTVIWLENNNSIGTDWIEYVINMHFYMAYSLDAADIDNDGDMDIVGASMGNWRSAYNHYFFSQIAWWEIIY